MSLGLRFWDSSVSKSSIFRLYFCYITLHCLQRLLPVEPEDRLKDEISHTESTKDFLTMCPLQIIDFHVKQSSVKFRNLFFQMHDFIVRSWEILNWSDTAAELRRFSSKIADNVTTLDGLWDFDLPVIYNNLWTMISLTSGIFLVFVEVECLRLEISRIIKIGFWLIVGWWKVVILQGDDPRWRWNSDKSRILRHYRVLKHYLTGSAFRSWYHFRSLL